MTPKCVFTTFSVLFQPLYFLMVWMYVDQLQTEQNTLAKFIDFCIVVFGLVFMGIQAYMLSCVRSMNDKLSSQLLIIKRLFYVGLAVWFLVEIVLGYWWCYVAEKDPLLEHTPFVVMFIGFNYAQYWSLEKMGVLAAA